MPYYEEVELLPHTTRASTGEVNPLNKKFLGAYCHLRAEQGLNLFLYLDETLDGTNWLTVGSTNLDAQSDSKLVAWTIPSTALETCRLRWYSNVSNKSWGIRATIIR